MKAFLIYGLLLTRLLSFSQSVSIEGLVRRISNSQFEYTPEMKLFPVNLKSSAADSLKKIGKKATKALLEALSNPEKNIAAHALLCEINSSGYAYNEKPKTEVNGDLSFTITPMGDSEGSLKVLFRNGKRNSAYCTTADAEANKIWWWSWVQTKNFRPASVVDTIEFKAAYSGTKVVFHRSKYYLIFMSKEPFITALNQCLDKENEEKAGDTSWISYKPLVSILESADTVNIKNLLLYLRKPEHKRKTGCAWFNPEDIERQCIEKGLFSVIMNPQKERFTSVYKFTNERDELRMHKRKGDHANIFTQYAFPDKTVFISRQYQTFFTQ